MDFENHHSEEECVALFGRLFPNGFSGPDVRRDLLPQGWAASPLYRLFHPTVEQRYEEAVALHRNLANFPFKKEDAPPPPPAPTYEEIAAEECDEAVNEEEEICRMVGLCLWDVFSDNHDVIDEDGREYHLGSFRASGEFLAERLNAMVAAGQVAGPAVSAEERSRAVEESMRKAMPEHDHSLLFQIMREQQKGPYDYMDFYLGSRSIGDRADLMPVYKMIFTRLRALDLDWKYSFPRLGLVDFRPMKEALDAKAREESGEPEWAGYDPEAEMAKEADNREKDQEIAEMQEKLDEGYRESVEAALQQEPPLTVRVYKQIYGDWPEGWPPAAE